MLQSYLNYQLAIVFTIEAQHGFYRVHDDEQLVEILRIYDNRMDIIAHLLNDRQQ